MKIALIGYGKMGKAIEQIAQANGHEIVLRISIENTKDFTIEAVQKADVAIEFTGPESAFENIKKCFEAGVSVVSGSTGWLKNLPEIQQAAIDNNVAFLYASNFSIGVNLFFELNNYLAGLMKAYKGYNPSITEIHHLEKKDAPSGTAITLAEQIMKVYTEKEEWVNYASDKKDKLEIISEREENVPGTHTVSFHSEIDDIAITHTAHNRKGFASGAVLAAEFINGKKGVFSMREVLFGAQ